MEIKFVSATSGISFERLPVGTLFVEDCSEKVLMVKTGEYKALSLHTTIERSYNLSTIVHLVKKLTVEL